MTREEFNDILRNAVSREFEDIPKDVPEHIFSDRFEHRMKRLIHSVEKYGTTPIKAFYKRAATIAATFFILIIATTQVQAIREPIVNFLEKIYDIYKELSFDGDVSTTITRKYTLGYIPEDYALSSTYNDNIIISYTYTNTDNRAIQFSQRTTKDSSSFIDNENTIFKKLNISGIETTIYYIEDLTYIQWLQDTYFMRITCNGEFDESEIIKMVESVAPIE